MCINSWGTKNGEKIWQDELGILFSWDKITNETYCEDSVICINQNYFEYLLFACICLQQL